MRAPRRTRVTRRITGLITGLLVATMVLAAPKKIVVLAGHMTHGPGDHEYHAGALLLRDCLASVPEVVVEVVRNDWPGNPAAVFDGAAAVVVYAVGSANHPLLDEAHAAIINRLAAQGAGLGFMHFATGAIPERMGAQMQDWV